MSQRGRACAVLALATIDTSIGLTASAIETTIHLRASPVQAPVDLVAAAIETPGGIIATRFCGSAGTRVETLVYAVALTVQPLLDPVTVPIGMIFNAVAGILGHRVATHAH